MIESSPTPASANDLVNASGRNIFPSIPPSAKTGRNDRSMMSDREEDRPADLPAGGQDILARVAARPARRRIAVFSRCITFSAITIDESTSTPIEMASPASDMRFVWTLDDPESPQHVRQDEREEHRQRQRERDDERRAEVAEDDHDADGRGQDRLEERAWSRVPIAPSISGVRS